MTRYELTTIVADESVTSPAVAVIEANGGTIIKEEAIGKRRFVYPIQKLTNGVYDRITFESEAAAIAAIDAALRHDPTVIRHLIVVQHVEPQVEVAAAIDEAAIEALGDTQEMTKQAEAAAKKHAKEQEAEPVEASDTATEEAPAAAESAESVEEEAVEAEPIEAAKTPATDETTAGEHAAVNDASVVDEATRQAALDEKLKNILGK